MLLVPIGRTPQPNPSRPAVTADFKSNNRRDLTALIPVAAYRRALWIHEDALGVGF